MLKHGILGLLNYGDMTGYEINAVFKDSLNYFWQAQTSQIYRELQALEKNGWITSKHVEQKNKPDKKILSITEEGKEELGRWLREEEASHLMRSPLLMKTFFRGECSIEENIEYFRSLPETQAPVTEEKESILVPLREYQTIINDPRKGLFWKFTLDYGEMHEKMLREWCEKCIKELEAIKDEDPADQR